MAEGRSGRMTERKHRLRKLAAGDYLLLSNDAETCWRIARYEDSSGWLRGEPWGLWKWPVPVVFGKTGIEVDSLDAWEFIAGQHATRQAAIDAALATSEEGER